MGWEGVTDSTSLVLCKAQLPTGSRAFSPSKVLLSSSTKLPLMGLSAPSRSKGGTSPTVLSVSHAQPLSSYLFLRCAALTPMLTTDLPHKCLVTYLQILSLSSHPRPTETQLILWGVSNRGKRHTQPVELRGQEVALAPACRRALVVWWLSPTRSSNGLGQS